MKRLFVFLLFLFSIQLLLAESSCLQKLDANLRRKIRLYQTGSSIKKGTDENISILIRSDQVQQLNSRYSIESGTITSEWMTAKASLSSILELAKDHNVQTIQSSKRIHFKNDFCSVDTRASKANNGDAPLTQSYTGSGIIVGIIDTGIDIEHKDFQNSNSTTRILYLWDQNETDGANPPNTEGYSYGQEWTASDINLGTCTHEDADGHGTHVSGTAVGNGLAIDNYTGMAPEADIIVVATDESSAGIADAANYIYKKADAMGKPCVINASLGWHSGFHDGTDGVCEILDDLVQKPGRLFCASAGNEGGDNIHLTPPAVAAPMWTYYFAGPDGYIQLYIRVPNQYIKTVSFSVGMDASDFNPEQESGGPTQSHGKTNYYTAEAIQNNQGVYKTLSYSGNVGGRISFETEIVSDSVTGLVIHIEEDELNWNQETGEVTDLELWRLYIQNGNPHIDVWIADIGYPFPDIPNALDYLAPDNYSSVGLPAVANNVIGVGASINRTEFTSRSGETIVSEGTKGDLASFSSLGPTADNRIKPEIVAPGHNVVSALSLASLGNEYIYPDEIAEGGKHFVASGTSMSSPAVAGCLALFLQMHPNATYDDVITAFRSHARQDGFTGNNLPDNNWGYGKMDIFEMLKETSVSVQNQFSDKFVLLNNYPNPFNPKTEIRYQVSDISHVKLTVFDVMGREIAVLADEIYHPGSYKIHYDPSAYKTASNTSGVYICHLQTDLYSITQKMLYLK